MGITVYCVINLEADINRTDNEVICMRDSEHYQTDFLINFFPINCKKYLSSIIPENNDEKENLSTRKIFNQLKS